MVKGRLNRTHAGRSLDRLRPRAIENESTHGLHDLATQPNGSAEHFRLAQPINFSNHVFGDADRDRHGVFLHGRLIQNQTPAGGAGVWVICLTVSLLLILYHN
jgi:hypothetical protein